VVDFSVKSVKVEEADLFMMTKSEETEQEFLLGRSSGYQISSYNSITYVSKVEFRDYAAHSFWKVFVYIEKLFKFSVVTGSNSRKY
jgi:hypothetical protein